MKLHAAMTIAERIQLELAPFCEPGRCTIAGSIRRARQEVNDIDLVMLPKAGQMQLIKDRCRQRCRVVTDGRQNFIVAMRMPDHTEFQLDIFFAHAGIADLLTPKPSNYGSLLLCRTGSQEHNVYLCQEAKRQDKAWKPYEGVYAGGRWERTRAHAGHDFTDSYFGGQLVASETEEQVFEALGTKWLAPAYREIREIHNAHNASQSEATA